MTTKSEVVTDSYINICLTHFVWNIIKVTVWVWLVIINCRRDLTVSYRECTNSGFNTASSTE